jgi:hypothetical protein
MATVRRPALHGWCATLATFSAQMSPTHGATSTRTPPPTRIGGQQCTVRLLLNTGAYFLTPMTLDSGASASIQGHRPVIGHHGLAYRSIERTSGTRESGGVLVPQHIYPGAHSAREETPMFAGVHWAEVIPLIFIAIMLLVVTGMLAVVGRSIGAGYARARHKLEQRPEQP